MDDLDPELLELARSARTVTVLSGAGMSAESGVPTFRDAGTGLWARWSPEELATPEAWDADPELVWSWYLWRARQVRRLRPNAGHRAIARWAERARVHVVTQNVDDLHERAGSTVLAHLHGSLFAFRCSVCDAPFPDRLVTGLSARTGRERSPGPEEPARERPPACRACGGPVRPAVVWFGELLPEGAMDRAASAVAAADLVLVVGTSGLVQPAASLPLLAAGRGTPVVEVNPEDTALTPHADRTVRAGSAEALPRLLAPPDDRPAVRPTGADR
ncbi:NAD-dependent deacylase [uncultured Kocuria sp.]|uniref:SIR2 family NAD-dependent protein deacylase n=1 Tax=uncultured Kocuria sp. TaxID=259305 RepID=UPI002628D6E8|nr:NAD-dependent deacylase [uncultured Kocuria sp.]